LDALVGEAVARGADAVGVAGGDGSLAVVAAAAQTHCLPFVCIPAGTRNHFALDLGVDRRDLVGALDAFTDGAELRIDLAYVNGRLFLNNTVRAVLGPSGAAPDLHLVDDLGHEHSHPAVVLVSNNPYALDRPLVRGTRPSLSGGRLGILVLDAPRILDAASDPRRTPARAWSATSVGVDAPEPVHAGVDGEAVDLNPPLAFTIRPAALRVRISRRHPGASPSGRLMT
jgi:diacylglycerol kinase family enzyme